MSSSQLLNNPVIAALEWTAWKNSRSPAEPLWTRRVRTTRQIFIWNERLLGKQQQLEVERCQSCSTRPKGLHPGWQRPQLLPMQGSDEEWLSLHPCDCAAGGARVVGKGGCQRMWLNASDEKELLVWIFFPLQRNASASWFFCLWLTLRQVWSQH